jgi:hypothetical protein
MNSIDCDYSLMTSCWEHINYYSGYLKGENILGQLSDCQLPCRSLDFESNRGNTSLHLFFSQV